ncbi:LppP/LprE family lipoprotein [Microbacterium sp. gxy059]|uniref:LppP/LprE family lipoprotein n=1 Tax=Microbacterium sp. gxy059 TaxID=2957199 RepID=UPI003D988ABA
MMMRKMTAVGATALALLLAGCGAAAEPVTADSPPPPASEAETPEETAPEEPEEPEEACADLDAEAALDEALPQLPPPFPPEMEHMADHEWTTQAADLAAYDPCAELSWITVSIWGATASSPSQVALFHRGEFVQAATERAYGFWPEVERLSEGAIEVVYRWPQAGEGNANASGRSPMRFAWDDASQSVLVEGTPPPIG